MQTRSLAGCLWILLIALYISPASAQGKKPAKDSSQIGKLAPLMVPLDEEGIPTVLKIAEVSPNGSIQVGPSENENTPAKASDLKSGFYFGAVQEKFDADLKDATFVRGTLTVSANGGDWTGKLTIGKEAAKKVKQGNALLLFGVSGAKPTDKRWAPEVARFVGGEVPREGDGETRDRLGLAARNLRKIGLALHIYNDEYGSFPPASLIGPDGKPWHSWRVLVLPFVDQMDLFEEYKWSEPWDGPSNKKLLDKMPAIFQDPNYGNADDHFTKFVAITGEGMAFATEGAAFDGKELDLMTSQGRKLPEFSDSPAKTLLMAPAGPEREIPWTKPEDVVISNDFPGLGKKGGLPLPFNSKKGRAGFYLHGDGFVAPLLETIDADQFHSLLTIAGGEPVDLESIPVLPGPFYPDLGPAILIEENEEGTFVARLTFEIREKPPERKAAPPQRAPRKRPAD